MFEKIKSRLKDIEDNTYAGKEIEDELNKILKTIREVNKEISNLERKALNLLDRIKTRAKADDSEKAGFLSRIQSARVNIETIIDRGWNNIVSGRYEEAMKELLKGLKLSPNNTKVKNLLGWALIHMGKYDKAGVKFQEVLKSEPHNEMAQANLGYINYKKGLYGEAIERLTNIVENAKNKQATLYALYYLGLVYFEREMYNDSIEFLNKAIALGPNLYEAYYYLGKAYQERGFQNLAIQIWEKLIELNAYNAWAKKAKEELNGQ